VLGLSFVVVLGLVLGPVLALDPGSAAASGHRIEARAGDGGADDSADDDGAIVLEATGDSDGSADATEDDGGSEDAEPAQDTDPAQDADLMPGVRRGLSQRFSYGGFDAVVTSLRLFEPSRRSRDALPSAAMPPTGTTVPDQAPEALATSVRSLVFGLRAATELPIVRVELTTWNTTPATGQLGPLRLRAGRSLYPAVEVDHPGAGGSTDEHDGGTRLGVEFRVPVAVTALLDSAMLVVGDAGTRQAVVPLGPRPSERSVRNPGAVDTTLRSAAFGPAQQYPLGVFEVDRVEVGASVGHLGAPDVGLVWLGISYGVCVQGAASEVRPVLRTDLGAGQQAVGHEVRSGIARGPLPVAPACPGWATAVAHWQVPPSLAGSSVVLDLVDDSGAGPGSGRVVGAMRFEVPTLPDESTPPTMPRCDTSR
jgi:hypothetical protein